MAFATHTVAYSVGLCRVARRRFAVNPRPFRNYHDPIALRRSTEIRKEWDAAPDDVILVHPCTYALHYNSDECIRLVAQKPDTYRLVFVGGAQSKSDHEAMVALAHELGVADRVHFKPSISGVKNYLRYLSGADLGLIMLSETVANVRFGLSNRFVDLAAAHVPMISTPTLETTGLIRQRKLGWVVKTTSAAAFAAQIETWRALPKIRKEGLRKNVRTYAKQESWQSEFDDYCNHVPVLNTHTAPKVALIFQRGLNKNKRVLRMARSLIDLKGADVTLFVTILPPKNIIEAHPDIKFRRV